MYYKLEHNFASNIKFDKISYVWSWDKQKYIVISSVLDKFD